MVTYLSWQGLWLKPGVLNLLWANHDNAAPVSGQISVPNSLSGYHFVTTTWVHGLCHICGQFFNPWKDKPDKKLQVKGFFVRFLLYWIKVLLYEIVSAESDPKRFFCTEIEAYGYLFCLRWLKYVEYTPTVPQKISCRYLETKRGSPQKRCPLILKATTLVQRVT